MEKIIGVYKITNTVTGDFHIGSSKDIKLRWACHKCSSTWKNYPNNPMYLDMQKYGVDKFEFQVIAEAESDSLKETEQQFIEKLEPTNNNYNAKGFDVERHKKSQKKAMKEYQKSDKFKKYHKEYYKEYDKAHKDELRKYQNQLCCYNGEVLKLYTLVMRFSRAGIEHPTLEAKKYIIETI